MGGEIASQWGLLSSRVDGGGGTLRGVEGCLGCPEITADGSRAGTVLARAETLEGETLELEATGLLARALQHEVDHLQGILFIEWAETEGGEIKNEALIETETRVDHRRSNHRTGVVSGVL